MTVADVPAAFLEVAEAFAADRVGGLEPPAWKFWNFYLQYKIGGYWEVCNKLGLPYRGRSTISGIADEMARHNFQINDWWIITATATAHEGRLDTAAVSLNYPGPSKPVSSYARWWVGVRREHDPLGWPIAVGALYTRTVEPLIDYLIESPLYESHHDRLAAAVREASHGHGS